MKLLLTSAGLTNKTIANTLFEMVGKKPEEITVVFIPTAANSTEGDTQWVDKDLEQLKSNNFKHVEIADISTEPKEVWLPKFEQADVLFFEGGNTFYLIQWINKSGLKEVLPELLKTKVWVGVSAGSIVTNKKIMAKKSQMLFGENFDKTTDTDGLNYVNFYFVPHLNSDWFTNVRKENIEKAIEDISEKIYCMDDDGAIKVVDGKVEIVTEGEYLEFN